MVVVIAAVVLVVFGSWSIGLCQFPCYSYFLHGWWIYWDVSCSCRSRIWPSEAVCGASSQHSGVIARCRECLRRRHKVSSSFLPVISRPAIQLEWCCCDDSIHMMCSEAMNETCSQLVLRFHPRNVVGVCHMSFVISRIWFCIFHCEPTWMALCNFLVLMCC